MGQFCYIDERTFIVSIELLTVKHLYKRIKQLTFYKNVVPLVSEGCSLGILSVELESTFIVWQVAVGEGTSLCRDQTLMKTQGSTRTFILLSAVTSASWSSRLYPFPSWLPLTPPAFSNELSINLSFIHSSNSPCSYDLALRGSIHAHLFHSRHATADH